MAEKTMALKLLIDTKANRVLFAEAGKEVVDFLFGLLALPLGSIVKLLSKDQMVGSIGSLYSSLENLDSTYIQPNQDKGILLSPQRQEVNNLLLSAPNPPKVEGYYGCTGHSFGHGPCFQFVTNVCGIQCPSCPGKMNRVLRFVHPESGGMASGNGEGGGGVEGGYVKGVVTYTIMDDLSVTPMSSISSITLLSKFNVKNIDVLKEKNALELLKTSLESKTVLTDVFLASKD
ncbi:hypothetical protein IHE45_12G082000 [Dioscorea alata]|uniref:Uncharacterized protein n=1 Tax=Dioscorea alata TaxID=55571 RepID=A0ACB7V3S3_DIOAL|nr:hypothetical protein IHE45_12G082000 [Dioscorea alata]